MKQWVVSDGWQRLHKNPEFQARLKALRVSIRARYVEEMKTAGFYGRIRLRWRIASEYERESRKLAPSPHSLYFGSSFPKAEGR